MKDSYCNNPDDWDDLANEFMENHDNIVFTYCIEGGGALIVSINGGFRKLGTMPFGGSPNGRLYIGVFQRGFDHFARALAGEANASSLESRLGLATKEAQAMAQLFKALSTRINE